MLAGVAARGGLRRLRADMGVNWEVNYYKAAQK